MVVALAGLSACGPSPEPVTPNQQKETSVRPTEPQAVAAATFDLSPVAEPEIVGIARWKSPSATMSNLSTCGALPPELIEGNSKQLADLILRDVLGGAADTAQLASLIAMDAPIDAVAALDTSAKRREPFTAISVGLTSLDRARGAIEGQGQGQGRGAAPAEMAPGMWRIGDRENTSATCVIAASAGAAPARLICGARERDVLALGPYLARNAPSATIAGNDMHGELRFGPAAARYGADAKQQLKLLPTLAGSQLSIGEAQFDRAISEAALGLQDELTALIGDLDKVTLDIGVDPASCLSASGALQLRGNASWTAGSIADTASKSGPPPALFWQVPKDSDMAFFGYAGDPARSTDILRTLRALAEGAMAKFNVGTAADRKALASLLAPVGKISSTVSASGHIDAPPADGKKPQSAQQMLDSLIGSWVGWNLIGIDDSPEAMTKLLKDMVAVYTRQAALAAAYDKANRKEEAAQLDLIKRGKEITVQDKQAREKKLPPKSLLTPILDVVGDDDIKLPTLKTVAAPASLGKGALAIELKLAGLPSPLGDAPPVDPKKPEKKETVTLTLHLLLMADGKTTWLAFGYNKDELVKRLLSVKTGAAETDKLSARAGLEPLKRGKFVSGGFVSIVPITKIMGTAAGMATSVMGGGSAPPEVQELMRILGNLPHKGESPIFLTTEATAGGAPRSSMSFTMSKAAMEDIGAIVLGGLKIAARYANP
jgi:hypothetical protein